MRKRGNNGRKRGENERSARGSESWLHRKNYLRIGGKSKDENLQPRRRRRGDVTLRLRPVTEQR